MSKLHYTPKLDDPIYRSEIDRIYALVDQALDHFNELGTHELNEHHRQEMLSSIYQIKDIACDARDKFKELDQRRLVTTQIYDMTLDKFYQDVEDVFGQEQP